MLSMTASLEDMRSMLPWQTKSGSALLDTYRRRVMAMSSYGWQTSHTSTGSAVSTCYTALPLTLARPLRTRRADLNRAHRQYDTRARDVTAAQLYTSNADMLQVWSMSNTRTCCMHCKSSSKSAVHRIFVYAEDHGQSKNKLVPSMTCTCRTFLCVRKSTASRQQ